MGVTLHFSEYLENYPKDNHTIFCTHLEVHYATKQKIILVSICCCVLTVNMFVHVI